MIPGEFIIKEGEIKANEGRATARVEVTNTGDRPVQIGSHFHFFEVNKALEFDREKALGMRLNIPASAAIRFEPGEKKSVTLVEFGGAKRISGFNNLLNGNADNESERKNALEKAKKQGYKGA